MYDGGENPNIFLQRSVAKILMSISASRMRFAREIQLPAHSFFAENIIIYR
jgi:hypothetical protein